MARRILVALIALASAASGLAEQAWVKMRASELIEREVVSRDGRPLGEIEDFVLDVRNARVHYAVLAFGGWMGFGEELYAVPASALAPEPGSERVVLVLDTTPLVNMPAFEREPRPPLQQFVRASELIGRDVIDRTGEHAGEIKDAVLDLRRGLVLHFLFDYDERFGDQRALRLAPQIFSFPLDGGDAVVNISRERLGASELSSP